MKPQKVATVMKAFGLVILSIVLTLLLINSSQACSVSVNDLYQKNTLVGLAGSSLGIDLSKATSIGIEDYSKNFSGAVGGAGCPSHLNTQARVTIGYKKNKFMNCTASITISRSIQIGDELAPGPYEDSSSSSPISSCVAIPIHFPSP